MPITGLVHYAYDHKDKVLYMGFYFGFVGVIVVQAGILVLTIKHLWDKKIKKTIDQFKKVKKKKEKDHFRE